MVMAMSHEDKKKYKESFKKRKTRARKQRTLILSDKTKNLLSKKLEIKSSPGHPGYLRPL